MERAQCGPGKTNTEWSTLAHIQVNLWALKDKENFFYHPGKNQTITRGENQAGVIAKQTTIGISKAREGNHNLKCE